MSHKPPKNDVERLENVLEGLADFDEDDLESREEIEAYAAAKGIDFAKWGEEIRQKAIKQLALEQAIRIAEDQARHKEEVARLAARPKPTGTREEKVTRMRALVARAHASQVSAHFQKFEEATGDELDVMIVALEDLLERSGE